MKLKILFISVILLSASSVTAQFTNFQPANNVFGQPNFTTNSSGTALNRMSGPRDIAVDRATGKIFISEQNNHRVLRFDSLAAFVNGATAEAVFGGLGSTSSTLNNPMGIDVDSGGRLWVVDFNNNRILRFDNAATMPSNSAASGVLGQADFTTTTGAITRNKFTNPSDVSVDPAGRLWVAESGNNRVLRFDNAASKPNGADADAVLGQPNFTTATSGETSATRMWYANSLYADTNGRLWVLDAGNHRVLRYDGAASKPNGGAADGVLGQPNFTTNTFSVTATGMHFPLGVHLDSSGRLYVGDFHNHRVLIFANAATLANGAPASFVLGQPNFTTNVPYNGGVSASSMFHPNYPYYDEATRSLYVGDFVNNRVLRFADASVSVSGRIVSGNSSISRAIISATGSDGIARWAKTNSFGYYRFEGLPTGDSYAFTVRAKGFTFAPRVVTVSNDLTEFDFQAIE